MTHLFKQNEALGALLCAILIAPAWMLGHYGYAAVSAAVYLTAYVIGGYHKAREGLEELVKERSLSVELLMFVAAIGSALIGYWFEGALLILIFAVSGALESYAMNRSHREISALLEHQPRTAVLLEDGGERKVEVSELRPGHRLLVKPGENMPADAVLVQGETSVDEAAINGESMPADKGPGDPVYAGTLNLNGTIVVEVLRRNEETLYQRIIRLVQAAKADKSPAQQTIERFEGPYVKTVLVIALALMTVAPWLLAWDWKEAFYRAMVFLVVASPCALVASIMPATLAALSNGARRGVLFKGGVYLEMMADVKAIAFDKTGTLTTGSPKVVHLVLREDLDRRAFLQAVAAIERGSSHPLAGAIVAYAEEQGVSGGALPEQSVNEPGRGISAVVGGKRWQVGSRKYVGLEAADRFAAATEGGGEACGGSGSCRVGDAAMRTEPLIGNGDSGGRGARLSGQAESAAGVGHSGIPAIQQADAAGDAGRAEGGDGLAAYFAGASAAAAAAESVSPCAGCGIQVFVRDEEGVAGMFMLQDTIRDTSRQAIEQLRSLGVHTYMITGDHAGTAHTVASHTGVDGVAANCLPEDKVAEIRKLVAARGVTAMIGDGINDAPALAAAHVGIAMGAGTDAAIETADVVLVRNELAKVAEAVELSRRLKRIIRQNIVFSIAVILLLIAANFFQQLSLPLGVIGHEGSTLLVILNGLRLLR